MPTQANIGNWSAVSARTGHDTASDASAVVSSQAGASGPMNWFAKITKMVDHDLDSRAAA